MWKVFFENFSYNFLKHGAIFLFDVWILGESFSFLETPFDQFSNNFSVILTIKLWIIETVLHCRTSTVWGSRNFKWAEFIWIHVIVLIWKNPEQVDLDLGFYMTNWSKFSAVTLILIIPVVENQIIIKI